MDITCDMCGKPCQDQGTQGRGETNALPHPPLPHDQPHPSYPTGTTASSPIRSTHIRQNPPRHIPAKRTQPAQPHPPRDQPRPSYPTGTTASSPIRSTHIRQNPPRHIPAKRTQPAQPHPPRDQPRPSYPTGTPASSPIRSAYIRQSARNPRIHHAAQPPTNTPASHPNHSRAQNADHLAQNTPHSPNFTEVVCALGASIPNTVRSAQIHQSARNPRIHHAAQPPPDAPASYPHHSCAQNADHLAQNTPHSLNFTEVVCALGAHRTIGSTSKETQWMRIRSTPLRRTHTPPQVQTTLSAVDSLGVLSCASW